MRAFQGQPHRGRRRGGKVPRSRAPGRGRRATRGPPFTGRVEAVSERARPLTLVALRTVSPSRASHRFASLLVLYLPLPIHGFSRACMPLATTTLSRVDARERDSSWTVTATFGDSASEQRRRRLNDRRRGPGGAWCQCQWLLIELMRRRRWTRSTRAAAGLRPWRAPKRSPSPRLWPFLRAPLRPYPIPLSQGPRQRQQRQQQQQRR